MTFVPSEDRQPSRIALLEHSGKLTLLECSKANKFSSFSSGEFKVNCKILPGQGHSKFAKFLSEENTSTDEDLRMIKEDIHYSLPSTPKHGRTKLQTGIIATIFDGPSHAMPPPSIIFNSLTNLLMQKTSAATNTDNTQKKDTIQEVGRTSKPVVEENRFKDIKNGQVKHQSYKFLQNFFENSIEAFKDNNNNKDVIAQQLETLQNTWLDSTLDKNEQLSPTIDTA